MQNFGTELETCTLPHVMEPDPVKRNCVMMRCIYILLNCVFLKQLEGTVIVYHSLCIITHTITIDVVYNNSYNSKQSNSRLEMLLHVR